MAVAEGPETRNPLAPRAAETETSGVRIPPPLFYLGGFLIGVGVELAVPIDRPAPAITVIGALIGIGGWLALDGAAMLFFRRAGTSMIPISPSKALITTYCDYMARARRWI